MIPLTGVTLPFVSYGGSSVVANFVLALLLMVSEQACARVPQPGGRAIASASTGGGAELVNTASKPVRPGRAAVRGADRLHVLLVGVRCRRAGGNPTTMPLLEEQQIRRGLIVASDGTVSRATARAARHASTSGSIRRASCSGIRSATASWSGARGARARVQRRADRKARRVPHDLRRAARPRARGDDRHTPRPRCAANGGIGTGRRAGAIVAIEPASGRVRTMVSVPATTPTRSALLRPAACARVAVAEPHRAAAIRRAPRSRS